MLTHFFSLDFRGRFESIEGNSTVALLVDVGSLLAEFFISDGVKHQGFVTIQIAQLAMIGKYPDNPLLDGWVMRFDVFHGQCIGLLVGRFEEEEMLGRFAVLLEKVVLMLVSQSDCVLSLEFVDGLAFELLVEVIREDFLDVHCIIILLGTKTERKGGEEG
jgi:hypothetical protein